MLARIRTLDTHTHTPIHAHTCKYTHTLPHPQIHVFSLTHSHPPTHTHTHTHTLTHAHTTRTLWHPQDRPLQINRPPPRLTLPSIHTPACLLLASLLQVLQSQATAECI
jgi:hypothetical protein